MDFNWNGAETKNIINGKWSSSIFTLLSLQGVLTYFFYKKLKLKNAVLYGNEYRNKQLLNRVNLSFPF